jgi:serine/threonine protein kinase
MIKQPKGSKKETPLEKVTKIVGQICEAVRFIHHNNVIHRDIKPENILLTMVNVYVTQGNTVKICDFGWSIYNPNKEMRLTLCGTPLYLAPEMVAQISYD